jgi:hypothetical protein
MKNGYECLERKRKDGNCIQVTDVVYSPDDGGFYLNQTDFETNKRRSSKHVWPYKLDAVGEFNCGCVEWEGWR